MVRSCSSESEQDASDGENGAEAKEQEELTLEQDDADKTTNQRVSKARHGSNVQKGKSTDPDEVAEISRGQCHQQEIKKGTDDEKEASSKQCRSIFQRKFTARDDIKILKALLKNGYTCGTRAFWRTVNDSLNLSIPVNQTQLYEKVRRLRDGYVKRLRNGITKLAMNRRELKIHKLSEKIWGKEENPQPDVTKEVNPQDDDDNDDDSAMVAQKFLLELKGSNDDSGKFEVDKALGIVRGRKRWELRKKWEELHAFTLQLDLRRKELIQETIEAAESFPRTD